MGAQVDAVLAQLELLLADFQSERTDIVKLNVYVRDTDVRTLFAKRVAVWPDTALPAVSYVATPLPRPDSAIALDAVFVCRQTDALAVPQLRRVDDLPGTAQQSHAAVLPLGDVVYVAGQAEPGDLAEATRATLKALLRTLKHLELDRKHMVQLKCFLQPMRDVAIVDEQIATFFNGSRIPPVSHVEWISGSNPIEIELVAWAPPQEAPQTVGYIAPPWMQSSPVFSRVARIHGNDRIYVSGLYPGENGSGESQVRSVFQSLEQILQESGSDLKHLAKATYYVADKDVSSQLNRLRPEYYDPQRPPAASKAMVAGVAAPDRSITIDMIAAPTKAGD